MRFKSGGSGAGMSAITPAVPAQNLKSGKLQNFLAFGVLSRDRY
jgi:hypothetical protein